MKNIIVIVFTLLILAGCNTEDLTYIQPESPSVQMVKGGILENYPHKTLGEAIEGFVGNPRWKSIEAEDGFTYVNIRGEISFHDKPVTMTLQYKLDGNSFYFNALEFNDIPQNSFMYFALIEKIYE